ncbi:MAG: 16S rRNA (adenine(1518)-N(6)/adenine(1519)-N(6))-dimethyltransferase RsmA [Chloroflexota bacterium]
MDAMSGEGESTLAARVSPAGVEPVRDRTPGEPAVERPQEIRAVRRHGFSKPTSPAALLRELGLRPRKTLSQSFLTDNGVVRQIVAAADVGPEDDVLEVGPGLGILTQELAARARRVVAFELDRELAAALPRLLPENVEIVQGDALELEPASHFSGPYKLAANLPYQITSPFLFRYLSLNPGPSVLVVMVQREVAERIAARPGELSYLAVAVQSAAAPRIVRLVPPGAFHPRPNVESAVVKLEPLAEPLVPPEQRTIFLDVVRAGFGQPRKQLLNSLHQGLGEWAATRREGWSRDEVRQLLVRSGIDAERRPQALTLDDWRLLFETFAAVRQERSSRT